MAGPLEDLSNPEGTEIAGLEYLLIPKRTEIVNFSKYLTDNHPSED